MRESDNFYNTYNARHLNPKEVAETFINSYSFEKLIQNNHSIILGARGCGKTTLMKMLTLPALHSWKGEKAASIRENISFYSIYISTDIYWDVKNQTYGSQLSSFGKFSEVISAFSVNSNVFTAICETFRNIIDLELKDEDEGKEIELCLHLIKAWRLNSTVPKLEYVIEALNERIDEVNQLIQYVIFNIKNEEDIPKKDYFNLTFETSLEYIIPVFQRIYGIKGSKKWALCFDELEFAPLWLQEKLFISLRSRTQYILYKLSSSPILSIKLEKSFKRDYSATSGNDVQMIKMWGSSDNENFSKQLIDSLLKKKTLEIDCESFFGSNEIYNKNPDSYEIGSEFYYEMIELIKKDDSFKNFLVKYGVDINNPVPSDSSQKDTLFRKIKPLVYFRNFYIDKNSINDETGKLKVSLRSRKTNELYWGIEVLSKVCDGNPRWLIGLVNSILANSKSSFADKKIQSSELVSTAKRFANVIANIPVGEKNPYSLYSIVNKIGKYFNDQILGTNFTMDPKCSFIVNQNNFEVDDFIIDLLEKGTSQGAFILLDSDDDSFDFEIRKQRFKFSYLISILYRLPLRRFPAIKLSECLKSFENEPQNQMYLFN
ncbi:hypothetical protein ACI6Q2_20605 [Chitinophagaceae bacterium LWZ2-11]